MSEPHGNVTVEQNGKTHVWSSNSSQEKIQRCSLGTQVGVRKPSISARVTRPGES
jgi:hypothetical protein